jgi:hypothetical protein
MHVLKSRIIQLVDQYHFKDEDWEHAEELESVHEICIILKDITENDDLVQDDHHSQKNGGLFALCLADLVQEVLLQVFLFKLHE